MLSRSPSHWTDRFLSSNQVRSVDEAKKQKQLAFVCYLTSAGALVNLIFSILIDFPVGIYTMAVSSVVLPLLPFGLRRGIPSVVIAHIYLAIIFVDNVLLITASGGLSSSITSPYIVIMPILGLMLIGKRAGLFWLAVSVVEVVVLGTMQLVGVDFVPAFDQRVDQAFKLSSYLGLVVIVFFIVQNFDAIAQQAFGQVNDEREQSERLLLNILPAEVADELKRTGGAVAREFDEVSVLFSDFSDFTSISSTMSPSELVAELNACFSQFDAIVNYYNLEKIKTIGDAYMAAAGLSHESGSNAVDMVHAALDMQSFLLRHHEQNRAAGKPAFRMRIGIHTGPVVAGIVGASKFQYDIWGDAVNTAARMESSGQVGRVNISEATYDLVRDDPGLVLTARGKIEAKGKGKLAMYFADLH